MLQKNKVFKNDNSDSPRHIGKFHLDRNAMRDEGKGKITFSNPLTITDNSEQWSGTKYDIPTLNINSYNHQLTADHSGSIEKMIGKTFGIRKVANRRVTIDGIQFAVEQNPLALYAYNMLLAGYLTDFSTETTGPWPDDDGVFRNAELVGLSLVVAGNNKQARVNEITLNSIKQAEELGLDTSELMAILKTPLDNKSEVRNNDSMTKVRIKNDRNFAVKVTFKNDDKDEEKELKPGETVDVDEDEAEGVQSQVDGAKDPNPAPTPPPTQPNPNPTPDAGNNQIPDFTKALNEAVKPLMDKINKFETEFNNPSEPQFMVSNGKSDKITDMSWKERHGKQINAAWDYLKGRDASALKVLNEINKVHLNDLQKAGLVENAVTIADMGNFVISKEMFGEIEGIRSNYRPLLDRFTFRDTLSTQMAWLTRNGDINMQEVEFCDDDADGNLKPISEYGADIQTSNLSEVAAVTPVCNAATRFLAVDLLSDVAEGYRNDFDRKKAQLLIARLQQAVNASGNTGVYNVSGSNALTALFSIMDVAADVAANIDNGVWIFNQATYFELLKRRMTAGTSQDSQDLFTTGQNAQFLGYPYIVVPNDLMPTLNTAQTKTFTVDGVSVTINQGMFFVDPATFTGRTSGGLQYDLSTEAAYEDGENVKSAFQRNELVVRGSFFRGGAVKNIEKVAGLGRAGVS